MRFRKSFMEAMAPGMQRRGLSGCPICGSKEALVIDNKPVLVVDGERPPRVGHSPIEHDPDRQLTFAARTECTTCGYLMLFNSERYGSGDEQTLVVGLTAKEEQQLEQ